MQGLLNCTSGLLQANYRAQGQQALNHRQQAVQQLLSQRQLPPTGWNEPYIEALLGEIAMMDSNNFIDTVGVGEREGRVFSDLVRRRHLRLSHGMGRSGDLLAQQPKAAGSSLLLTLTHALTLHAIRLAGLTEAKQVLLLPVATGMSIVLTLTALRQTHPRYIAEQKAKLKHAQAIATEANGGTGAVPAPSGEAAATTTADATSAPPTVTTSSSSFPPPPSPCVPSPSYVIWSRIDQKTCLKSIFASGLVPIVIELQLVGDQLETDLAAMDRAIQRVGPENVLAVVSTTSCFAPRAPDKVVDIAKMCARYDIAHVVNHAYGLQCASTCSAINSAVRKRGRVDAVIASMDKNFLVPVGGAMVIGFADKEKKEAKPRQATGAQGPTNHSGGGNSSATPTPAAPATPSSTGASTPLSSSSSSVSSSLPRSNVLHAVSSLYPGRASSSAITDLFITLLSMGASGWQQLLRTREELFPKFQARLAQLAEAHGERLLVTRDNPISFAMTLDRLEPPTEETMRETTPAAASAAADASAPSPSASSSSSSAPSGSSSSASASGKFVPSYLGSLLFSRNVSGPRVLSPQTAPSATINGVTFRHYGTHADRYPHAYVTAACAIGMEEREVEAFAQRLDKCMREFGKQRAKHQQRAHQAQGATKPEQRAAQAQPQEANSKPAEQPATNAAAEA